MPYETIVFERRDSIGHLLLNRPAQGNALSHVMHREIAALCQDIYDDDELRVLVVSGAGEHFCRGAVLSPSKGADPQEPEEQLPRPALAALSGLIIPTIAAIEGQALGEGLELALACDLRVAAEGAQLGLPQVGQGSLPAGGGTQRLARLVGPGRATEMLILGQPVSAAAAHEMGLVNRLTAPGEALAQALALAETIARGAPWAVRFLKEAVNKGLDLTLEQGLRLEGDLSFLLFSTADRAEGLRAFLERRTPHFGSQ